MVRTMAQTTGDEWEFVQESADAIVNFSSEPERQEICLQQAADIWQNRVLPWWKLQGKKLIPPSCTTEEQDQKWIEKVIQLFNPEVPDYLCLQCHATLADDMISFLEMMHRKLTQLPVIVPEIASIHREADGVRPFTVQLPNLMDGAEWIFAYGLLGCMGHVAEDSVSPTTQLMNEDEDSANVMKHLMCGEPMKV